MANSRSHRLPKSFETSGGWDGVAAETAKMDAPVTEDLPSIEVSQSPEDKFREYLASRPRAQRFTGQQRDMVKFIFSKHNHFDADQLIDDLKTAGFNVSRATVYRTLAKLVDAGLLRSIDV